MEMVKNKYKVNLTERELEVLIEKYNHSISLLNKKDFPIAIRFLEERINYLRKQKGGKGK